MVNPMATVNYGSRVVIFSRCEDRFKHNTTVRENTLYFVFPDFLQLNLTIYIEIVKWKSYRYGIFPKATGAGLHVSGGT